MLERVWRRRNLQPLWRIVWRFPEKLKIQLPYDPAIPQLTIYLDKALNFKRYMYPQMFTAALFTIAKRQKQLKCPSTDTQISKKWYIHTMKYYSVMKRDEVLTHITTCMNLENTMLSKRSQSQKMTQYMIPFIPNGQNRSI